MPIKRRRTIPARMATQPVNPAASRTQGPRIPTLEVTASEYSPTPTLSASPATTDASESLNEERIVQMNIVDHVSDPNGLKGSTRGWSRAVLPAGEDCYLAEFATGDKRKDSADKSLNAY
jgi:hypothetical protein